MALILCRFFFEEDIKILSIRRMTTISDSNKLNYDENRKRGLSTKEN